MARLNRPRLTLLALLLTGSTLSAHAASFDCQKATSGVEKALCNTPALGALDETNAEYYQQLMGLTAPAGRKALLNNQRAWLKQRNACGHVPSTMEQCLSQQFAQRNSLLTGQLLQALEQRDEAIKAIPQHPAQAAAVLQQFSNPQAAAWLVYLQQFEPASGVTRQQANRASQLADNALQQQDGLAFSLLEDTRKDPKATPADKVLLQLRMAIEHDPYTQSGPGNSPRNDLHCFIFSRQGDAAYNAFGPLYGSSRDSFAPLCQPQGGLFELPAWKQLRNQLAAPEERVSSNAGTIRFATYAAWRVMTLRTTLTPRDFLKTAQAADPLQRIRDWVDEKNWAAAQRQQTLATVPQVEAATAQWLQQERAFSPADAQTAAHNIVTTWLNDHLDFIAENSDDE